MKQKIILATISLVFLFQAKSQTITPNQSTEVCPLVDYTFTASVTGTNPSIDNFYSTAILVQQVYNVSTTTSNGVTTTTFNFKGRFNDVNTKQYFRLKYTNSANSPTLYDYSFLKIKSLLHWGTGVTNNGQPPRSTDDCSAINISTAPLQAPNCQITTLNISFAKTQYANIFETPILCFGEVANYEYLLPAGWQLGTSTSNGSTWLAGSNNVTITSNASTGGSIGIRPANTACGTPLAKGRETYIPISRPNPIFTISPSTVSMTCGTVFTKIFTVSTTGTLACPVTYNWNLGSTNNGWLYNGIAAPASFTTTANSITLTAANPYILPSNVTVTPVLNGTNQPLLTSTLSFAPLPLYTVSGDNIVCTTSNNYSVPTLPFGATVQWQAIPNNIVTINSPNATQTTITKGYNSGIITLIATITNQCGQVGQAYKYDISVGSGVSSLVGRYYLNDPSQPHELITYYSGINYIPANTICNVFIDNPGLESATWSLVSGNTNFWTQFTEGANHILQMHLPYSNEDIVTFRLTNTNSCGTYDFDVLFVAQWQYGGYFRISPNPTKDNLTISVDEAKLLANRIAKSSDQDIKEIVILDKTGMVQAKQTYSKGTRQINMNISNLKTGIYIVRIFNGKEWTALKLVKE